VRWSDIVEEAAPLVLLRLESDSGAVGVAEITVKPTWCGFTARSLVAAVEEVLLPRLKGVDLDDPSLVRAVLDQVPENQAAKSLVDNACWDLYAHAQGRPLWRVWGGRRKVELSWAVTRQAPKSMAEEAARMVERHGFGTLKVKGGQGVDTDVAGMREIRAAVGDAVRLYVDANGAYSAAQAPGYVRAMADAGAVMVEDPCIFAPDDAFRTLQQDSPVPLLVDFGCASRRDAALFIEHGARALNLKPGRFGLTDVRSMQGLAQAAGCVAVAGLMGESALGTLAALQFAATLGESAPPAELTWYLAMTEQIVGAMPPIVNGAIELPESAALSALVDWEALQKFAA
jgi:L-alanine-DL-glutamate epimerase-like enolase superfamily enzyme